MATDTVVKTTNPTPVTHKLNPVELNLAVEAPPMNDHESSHDHLVKPSVSQKTASAIAIIAPFLGLIVAIIMMWNSPFSWLNLSLFLGGYLLTTLGITIGYHRLFTHRSFKANRLVVVVFGVLGSMAIQGPVLEWVATHRRHHQHTDRDDDPHSPHAFGTGAIAMLRGMVHSHFGWFFAKSPTPDVMDKYVPDLMADPVVRALSRWFLPLAALGLLIPAAIGLAVTGSWMGALMAFIWGGLLRVFFVHHVTWSVNSVCHIWGSQPFNTHDESRNNFSMGVLAMGEGWHNTHHAFPASARHGLSWWQPDASYWIIVVLAKLRLVRDIKLPSEKRIESRRRTADATAQPASVPTPHPVAQAVAHAVANPVAHAGAQPVAQVVVRPDVEIEPRDAARNST